MLPEASQEQQRVVDAVDTHNVVVDSVAGSGKTTTVLHIAKQYPQKSILLITYNARLKSETRQKAVQNDIKNMEVHSYHSFCYKHYDKRCTTDDGIIKFLKAGLPKKQFNYDVVVIDEAQDMTSLYYTLVCTVLFNNDGDYRVCVIGDKFQSIYKFNGADERYITKADTIFAFNKVPWKQLRLPTSYRITHEMAGFINHCVLQDERMKAVKHGPVVRYVICDTFCDGAPKPKSNARTPYMRRYQEPDDPVPLEEIQRYLRKYNSEDIFVLAPSLKASQTPARVLANKLTELGVPVFVPNTDEEKLDEEVIKGKIVFSTFHQSKGCERKVVLVYCFDEFYMSGIDKHAPTTICPNAIYVAITRARECLTVFHHYANAYLPFLGRHQLQHYANVCSHRTVRVQRKNGTMPLKKKSVTEITKFLPADVMLSARDYVDLELIQDKDTVLDIPVKTQQGTLVESVAELNGTVIPAYLQYMYQGTCVLFDKPPSYKFIDDSDDSDATSECSNITSTDINDIPSLLKMTNEYCSRRSGYTYKLAQIQQYDWLSKEELQKAIERLQSHISRNSKFELAYTHSDRSILFDVELIGCIDCLDQDTVWEFKCVNKLTNEHVIQLALYAYLVETRHRNTIHAEKDFSCSIQGSGNNDRILSLMRAFNLEATEPASDDLKYKYMLFNIMDNKIVQLTSSYDRLCEMVKYVIQKKFQNDFIKSDKDFMSDCVKTAKTYGFIV
jgi:hypothetical protein